jgi:predicted phage tail protein
MSQAVILKFHPTIRKYTNGINEHTVNVNDFMDIKNCLEFLFPDLGIHIRRIRGGANRRENLALVNKNKRVLQTEDYFINRLDIDDTEFYVVPLFIGGGGNAGMIIIGVALIALVIVTGGTALAGAGAVAGSMGSLSGAAAMGFSFSTLGAIGGIGIGSMLMSLGVSLIISGVMGMMMKPPKLAVEGAQTTDSESRSENKIFQGLQNTTNSNVPVPMVYGRTRVGGQFISGEIRAIQHGRNETIKISSLFPPGAN